MLAAERGRMYIRQVFLHAKKRVKRNEKQFSSGGVRCDPFMERVQECLEDVLKELSIFVQNYQKHKL